MFQHSCATVFIFDSINLRAHIGLDSLFRLRTLWTLSVAGRLRECAAYAGFPSGSPLCPVRRCDERCPLLARNDASFMFLRFSLLCHGVSSDHSMLLHSTAGGTPVLSARLVCGHARRLCAGSLWEWLALLFRINSSMPFPAFAGIRHAAVSVCFLCFAFSIPGSITSAWPAGQHPRPRRRAG